MKCKYLNEQVIIIDVDGFIGTYKTVNYTYNSSYSYYRSAKETDTYNTHFTVYPTDKGNGEFTKFHISLNFSKTGIRNANIYYKNGVYSGYSDKNLTDAERKTFGVLLAEKQNQFNKIAEQFWTKSQSEEKTSQERLRKLAERNHIQQIKRKIEDDLLAREGVTGVDIDYKIKDGVKSNELAIIIFVDKKHDVPSAMEIPKLIHGIKTDVWEGTFTPYSMNLKEVDNLSQNIVYDPIASPMIGGISVGPFDLAIYGTLGVVLETTYGVRMILSSAHVLASSPHTIHGNHISQPALPHGGHWPESDAGTYFTGFLGQPNNIDAALATIVHRNTIPNEIMHIGQLTGRDVTFPGDDVAKFGRTTQFTVGKVISDTLTFTVNYQNFGNHIYYNQLRIQDINPIVPFSLPGDSGSIVINEDKEVVGMIMAGGETANGSKYTIANPINDIVRTFEANGIRFI